MANEVLPIAELLQPYEGQEVFVVVEVVELDPKTNEPLTGRLLAVTSNEREAGLAARQVNSGTVMIRWMGKPAEVVIVHAHPSL
jgi:hypothetical protein